MRPSWRRWLGWACLVYLLLGVVVTAVLLFPRYQDATPAGIAFAVLAWPYMIFFAISMARSD